MTSPLQGSDEETQERMAGIRARLSAATQWPWHVGRYRRGMEPWIPMVSPSSHGAAVCYMDRPGAPEKDAADADFIANAPTDLAFLLSRVDSLESALREAQKDAERLDWLEAQAVQDGVDLDGIEPSSDAPVVCVTLRKPVRNREYEARTLRDAIDAAKSGEST